MAKYNPGNKLPLLTRLTRNLGLKTESPKKQQRREGYIRSIVPKSYNQARADIADWNGARRAASNVERPRRAKMCRLHENTLLDAHLTSQIELRMQHVLSRPAAIKHEDGTEDEESTHLINSAAWVTDINRRILETVPHGHSLVELTNPDDMLQVKLLPRTNVVPEQGLLLLREDDEQGIKYREAREFGTWLLEFGNPDDFGLLNKAVPHALFKRFAQSCWSELCEIYGIPPRYIKTDTQDPEMLDRAEEMMRDMGSAAWFVIDTTEAFEFAKGTDTNGDVYSNLIRLCNNEMSMLFIGAVIGQDTKNGNESKEKSSMQLFDKLVQADSKMVEGYWNMTVIPALVRIGILPGPRTFEFQQEEDLEKMWAMVTSVLQYKDVPNDWIEEKFGIKVEDKKQPEFSMYQMTAKSKGGRDFFG